jgi:tetratricopeptide (TPR) repeat protein
MVFAVMLLGNSSFAETLRLRVAFEWVPGAEAVEAGNLQAGIQELEHELAKSDLESSADVLATLCAAYIVNRSLDKAERACDKALEIKPSKTAYNNRGVLRAAKGDFSGAREDFDRVRPHQIEVYLEELWVKDVPLIAEDNFDLLEELLSTRDSVGRDRTYSASAATIENLSN